MSLCRNVEAEAEDDAPRFESEAHLRTSVDDMAVEFESDSFSELSMRFCSPISSSPNHARGGPSIMYEDVGLASSLVGSSKFVCSRLSSPPCLFDV